MEKTPIVLAWSGGKDSSLALAALRDDPRFDVVALLTTVTSGYERISMHGVRRDVLEAQVAAIGLPLEVMTIPAASSNLSYEAAFLDVLSKRFAHVASIAFGDLFLADIRAYREALVARAGFTAVFPLWDTPTDALARQFVARGFKAYLTCVDTRQLDGRFAGQAYDDALLDALPASVDPCGENGEFHTLVVDGPIFRHPIAVTPGERILRDDRFMYCDYTLG